MTSGRFWAAATAVLALTAAVFVVGGDADSVDAAAMCPPVTIEHLFPSEPPVSRPPSSPTTTGPTSTQPEAPTSTTSPDETSTTEPPSSATTVPGPTSTTAGAPPSTTTPGNPSTTTPTAPRPAGCVPFEYRLTWPLAADSPVVSTFGADREHGARHHEGIDIHALRLTPVVAVADGTVARITQVVGTEDCCTVVIRHDDGWQSAYVHLNNDRYGTDDGLGIGVRPDLQVGAEVVAGELIGWVGDSGNAEDSVDHLHFELRNREGVAVDPAPSLRRARSAAELPEIEPVWPYLDDETSGTQWVAARLLTEGLFLPCDESGIRFCPDQVADPDFARAIIRHFTGVEPPLLEGRFQEIPQVLAPLGDEQRLIGELMGCPTPESCLDFGFPQSELGRIAAWAVGRLQSGVIADPDAVIEMGQSETLPPASEAEAQLRARGLLGECRPPLDHDQLMTRESVVSSLVRWVLAPIADCVELTQLRR